MRTALFKHIVVIIVAPFVIPAFANAAPGPGHLLTYEGILTDSADIPITPSAHVVFQIVYTDATESDCVVYEEDRTVPTGVKGEFTVVLGEGTYRSDATGNTREQIFAKTGFTCKDGAPSQSGTPHHSLRIIVDGSTLSPNIAITNVPFSIQAGNADKLENKVATDFVQVNGGASLSQSNVESIFNRFTKLDAILTNFNASGNILSGNISGNAATATTATNVSGVVAVANGGTGAATQLGAANAILPSQTGNSGKYLITDGTNASWASSVGAVASVAGKTGAVTLVSADVSDATSANTASMLVKRDPSGNFGAGTITASGVVAATLQVAGGTPAPGKLLTSDASGNATWQAAPLSSQWTTSGVNIYYNAGNVGIGTVAPSEKMSVNGHISANGLKLGTTNRTTSDGGPAGIASNKIIIRSFVSNSSVDGLALFETPEWRLMRNGTNDQFRLMSLSSEQVSYWARSGTDYWKGDNPGVGVSVTFAPTSATTEFQIFFGRPYITDGKFAHIIINRVSTDFFWVGYITTNHDN